MAGTLAAGSDRSNAEHAAAMARESVALFAGGEPCDPGRVRIQGSLTNEAKIRLELPFTCSKMGVGLTLREDWLSRLRRSLS